MIFNLFFRIGPAIIALFEMGYEPTEEMFHELTEEQYVKLEEKGGDISKKWFAILPSNPKYQKPELEIVSEDEIRKLRDGVEFINSFCNYEAATDPNPPRLTTFQDKLKYAAAVLPEVFSEGTPYERYASGSHLKVIK